MRSVLLLFANILFALWLSVVYVDLFQAAQFVIIGGYLVILTTFIVFVVSWIRLLRSDGFRLADRGEAIVACATVAGCTVFLFLQEPFGFKIIMDEIVLSGTSMSMHFDRAVLVPLIANDYAGSFQIVTGYLDKRPFFHPLLVSLLHDLSGFRVENALLLNVALTPVFLALLYRFGCMLADHRSGILGVLIFTSLPLLAQNATGGHFEILNLVMILVVMLLAVRYLRGPDALALTPFCFAALLLTQTRYESVLFVLPVGIIVLLGWWRVQRPVLPWSVVFAPLFLVCYPMQFRVALSKPRFWQLDDTDSERVFGIEYFRDNLAEAGDYFFQLGQEYSNSVLLSVLGSIGLAFFVFYLFEHAREGYSDRLPHGVLALMLLAVIPAFGFAMGYHWGQLTDPVASRFSLPLMLVFVLAAVAVANYRPRCFLGVALILYGMVVFRHMNDLDLLGYLKSGFVITLSFIVAVVSAARVLKNEVRPVNYLIAVSLLFILTVTVPVVASHRYQQRYTPASEIVMLRDFFAAHTGERIFFVSPSPVVGILHGVSSASVENLKRKPEIIAEHLLHHNFDGIYAFQLAEVDPESGAINVLENYDLGSGFAIETVKVRRLVPLQLAQIVRIVGVRDPVIEEGVEVHTASPDTAGGGDASTTATGPLSVETSLIRE